MKLDILAVGVHPDDVELACSGTLLAHIEKGRRVGLLDLTRGELGTRGTADIRDMEAANSAQKMGALVRENLGMADGFFAHEQHNLLAIARMVRRYQPDIVLANSLNDRHPDHGRAAKLVADACFLAGLSKVKTEDNGSPQARWRPKAIYHYIQDYYEKPDFVVDITPFMERKIELVLTFRSQFYDPSSTELQTPISGKDFLDFLYARARDFGRPANVTFAEGFQVARTPGVGDLFALI
jgi:bacillithiol biosynthesis deacetylase BshB1